MFRSSLRASVQNSPIGIMNLARKRLTRKLLALFLVPVLICFVIGGLAAFWTSRSLLLDNADRELEDQLSTLRPALEALAASGGSSHLDGVVERIAAEETVHGCALYDGHAAPIARSTLLGADPGPADRAAASAMETGAPVHGLVRIGGREVLVRAEPVRDVPGLGAALMTHELGTVDRLIFLTILRVAITGGAVALVVGLLSVALARALGRGWGDFVHASERVAAGELSARVEASKLLELDRVARAFNDMTRSLAEAREKLLANEAERNELSARIRHAQALSVVGQVAGSFAHEIGSPLNTILGWARLGAANEALPEEARRQFETIAGQSERIARIVQRMLSVARPGTTRVERVSLGDVAREVTAFLAPDLRVRRVELRAQIDEEVPPIMAVRDQLLQVVLNLCVNAIQAQPGGGLLRVSVTRAEADEEEGGEPRVALEVADAGTGIPAELRAQIFELFYSTKRESGGTGLGLPIVRDIVRELGGKVEVRDAAEGGALFRVLLPATP
jgi:signal transduction histidine kinase